jgi:hypothetical protein
MQVVLELGCDESHFLEFVVALQMSHGALLALDEEALDPVDEVGDLRAILDIFLIRQWTTLLL